MSEQPTRVLIVDDHPSTADLTAALIRRELSGVPLQIKQARSAVAARELFDQGRYDIYLLDYFLGDGSGLELLRHLRANGVTHPVIMLTGQGDEQTAVEAMKAGATDYLVKRVSMRQIGPAVRYALELFQKEEQRKRAEEDLREANERLRALISASGLGVITLDPSGNVRSWSPAAEQVFGWTEVETRGERPPCIPEGKEEEFEELCQRVREGDVISAVETRWLQRNGARLNVNISAAPLCSAGGEVEGILALVADITQRKNAEGQIQRRNQELAALNAITAAASSSLELPDVLTTLQRLLIEHLRVAGGAIYHYEESEDRLYLAVSWGLPDELLEGLRAVPATRIHSEAVVRDHEVVFSRDLAAAAFYAERGLESLRPQWDSYLCVPLVASGEIQGVVDLFTTPPRWFGQEQLPFFRTLGQQAGVALYNARLFEQVRAGRERLAALSRRLVEVQETERRFIAAELHDEIGQVLTGLKLILENSARLPDQSMRCSVEEAQGLVNDLMGRVRQMSLDLRPAMLDDLGVLSALLWQFQRYTAQTGVQVKLKHVGVEGRRFPVEVETAAFRIVQEALTNVARYSTVKEVQVRLWVDEDRLGLQVEDRGAGFDPAAALASHRSRGLAGMRERAMLLGGQFEVESAPGEGVRLTAELPIGEPPAPPVQPAEVAAAVPAFTESAVR